MFIEIGSFEAKAKLSKLLQGVQCGERYTVTLRGKPIADLIPSENIACNNRQSAIAAMRNIRKVKSVSAEQVTAWIIEGRS